ncbi:MAG: dienelactone hydrolase family protein [Bdellovibrionota bacterium]
MKHITTYFSMIIVLLSFSASMIPSHTYAENIQTKTIKYKVDGQVFVGTISFDKDIKTQRPGILVVHEWWGHTDYAKQRTIDLAKLGYTALALDMYGDGKTVDHPKDAGAMSSALTSDWDVVQERFVKALSILKKHKSVDETKTAAIGYCMGGKIALEMARRNVGIDAVASFHGSLTTQHPFSKDESAIKVLVANGADDPFVKHEDVTAIENEMKAASIDYVVKNYKGAKHSFTNKGSTEIGKKFNLPLEYNEEADKDSWSELQKLLQKTWAS